MISRPGAPAYNDTHGAPRAHPPGPPPSGRGEQCAEDSTDKRVSSGRWSRRGALRAIGAGAAAAVLGACDRRASSESKVVLYSSADDEILKQVVAAFEKSSGVKVGVVTDTEATKTTGLVQRLLDEKDRPRADVWWSSEPLGSVRLAREGVLAEHTPGALAAGRPDVLNARAKWFVMPGRARVIAYSTTRVETKDAPDRVLAVPAVGRGRVGMARPQFGTTRAHMAAMLARAGEPVFTSWLGELKGAGVRLYDGNASVVRAISQGEIDVGLTDSDDVYAAQRNGWKVGMVLEGIDDPGAPVAALSRMGTVVLPNTAGLVAGGPNAGAAAGLLDFLLSEVVERMLAASESRHIPVRASVARDFPGNAVPSQASLDFEKIADAVPRAMQLCQSMLEN